MKINIKFETQEHIYISTLEELLASRPDLFDGEEIVTYTYLNSALAQTITRQSTNVDEYLLDVFRNSLVEQNPSLSDIELRLEPRLGDTGENLEGFTLYLTGSLEMDIAGSVPTVGMAPAMDEVYRELDEAFAEDESKFDEVSESVIDAVQEPNPETASSEFGDSDGAEEAEEAEDEEAGTDAEAGAYAAFEETEETEEAEEVEDEFGDSEVSMEMPTGEVSESIDIPAPDDIQQFDDDEARLEVRGETVPTGSEGEPVEVRQDPPIVTSHQI